MTKLYKCFFTSSIRDLPHKTDYLRCESKVILYKMFCRCRILIGSEYYGYETVQIKKMKMSDFPEIKTIQVKSK